MVKGMMERVKWKTWHNHEKRPPHPAGQWSRRLKSGHVRGPRKVGWKSVEIYGGSGGHVIQFFSCCDFLGRRCWFFRPAMVISVQLWQFVIRICLVACSFHLPGFHPSLYIFYLYCFWLTAAIFFGCAPQRAPVKVARLTAAALSKRLARELPHDKRCPRRICQDLISVSLFACFFVGVPGQLEQQEALKQMHVFLRFSQNHFFGARFRVLFNTFLTFFPSGS